MTLKEECKKIRKSIVLPTVTATIMFWYNIAVRQRHCQTDSCNLFSKQQCSHWFTQLPLGLWHFWAESLVSGILSALLFTSLYPVPWYSLRVFGLWAKKCCRHRQRLSLQLRWTQLLHLSSPLQSTFLGDRFFQDWIWDLFWDNCLRDQIEDH